MKCVTYSQLANAPTSVTIDASKDGVKFSCNGDIGNGSVTLRTTTSADKPETNVEIELSEPVALTFSLKYLINFCKAQGLSKTVKVCLSNEVPLLVEYTLASNSYLRFYLAPKVCLLLRIPSFTTLTTRRSATRSKPLVAKRCDEHAYCRRWLGIITVWDERVTGPPCASFCSQDHRVHVARLRAHVSRGPWVDRKGGNVSMHLMIMNNTLSQPVTCVWG